MEGEYMLMEAREGIFAFTRGKERARVLVVVNVSDSNRVLKVESFNYDLLKNEYIDKLTIKAGEPGVFEIR
jgi:hypothetical protein